MIELLCEKLYRYDRKNAPLSVAVPFRRGQIFDYNELSVWEMDEENAKKLLIKLPVQVKVTAKYSDGSIRFLFVRFMGNLPGMKSKKFYLFTDAADFEENKNRIGDVFKAEADKNALSVKNSGKGFIVNTGKVEFEVEDYSENIFAGIKAGKKSYLGKSVRGPLLQDGCGDKYDVFLDKWKVTEEGPLCVVLKCMGKHQCGGDGCEEGKIYSFEVTLTAWYDKDGVEVAYRLINDTAERLDLKSLEFKILKDAENAGVYSVETLKSDGSKSDSTGCGDMDIELGGENSGIYTTIGISDLSEIEERIFTKNPLRLSAGRSNYRTTFKIGTEGDTAGHFIGSAEVISEGNEHFTEVFYGTLFADYCDGENGVTATVFQAAQNYPKAVMADKDGICVMLVPECEDKVSMASGMSRTQKFLLQFYEGKKPLVEVDNESLIYQMPDRPVFNPQVFRDAGISPEIFTDSFSEDFEIHMVGAADSHSRSFGMMNFGDTIDWHYTKQGRGGGDPVWSNNEYDYPHAIAQLYMRTQIRRFLDYNTAHAMHWMDVDVCHYKGDEERYGGQIEHTAGHVREGAIVPSHSWCEGLLDYYHLTGDERGLETALLIGENVLKLLELPKYKKAGEANARETGWALRLLSALYFETGDDKWKAPCERIVGYFESWFNEFGNFCAMYTDNIMGRVPFMTAVAAGSLMRYYRIFPSESLKKLIVNAVDDIYDNCRLPNGLFFYKELPSLSRNGTNNLLLEAMAIGYELTGDMKYIKAGEKTYLNAVSSDVKVSISDKKKIGDAVSLGNSTTKNFAQSMYPLCVFHKFYMETNGGEVNCK